MVNWVMRKQEKWTRSSKLMIILLLLCLLLGNLLLFQQPAVVLGADIHFPFLPGYFPGLPHSETLLLTENFEDGQIQGWNYNPADWQIITDPDTGSHVWTTILADTAYASTGSSTWSDYRFQLQVRRVNSNANLYFRNAGAAGYALRVEASRLVLWTERNGPGEELASANANIGNGWHTYEIKAVDRHITVTIDSAVLIDFTDSGPASLSGGIGLEAFINDGVRFDNIQVVSLLPEEGANPWVQTNGPAGGLINTIEIHPTQPDTLFAGGSGGGVYKTTNGGTAWTLLPPFVSPSQPIYDILISSTNPQVIYAHAWKLYKSSNGGQNWTSLANERGFTCVAMDLANPARLLAGTPDGQVFLSSDGGTTWNDLTANLPGYYIKDIAFGDGNELWAGTIKGNGLLYHSVDGASWNPVNLGQAADSEISTIFVDPQNRDIVYVGLQDIHNEVFDSQNDI